MNKVILRFVLISFFTVFSFFVAYSQSIVKGTVLDVENQPVPFANVIIKPENGQSIITFTSTDEKGKYTLKITQKGKFVVSFTSLSYKTTSKFIEIGEENLTLKLEATLVYDPLLLNEVMISQALPIKEKKDTIVFDAKSFSLGNEQILEDLLKRIPGINIDSDGTIKIGNKEIEKIMVEGDDFFERGYKILSKNMPASPIDKIEILKRYSNNRHLKGIEQSDKVALNLILDENAKRKWFGNLNIGGGIGSEKRYDIEGNLMNFGKRNKYYFLTNFNNIGNDATGDISNFIKPSSEEASDVGNSQSAKTLIDLSISTPNFQKSRSIFNNEKLLSLNSIFNPTKYLKIKVLFFSDSDKNTFYRNTTDFINISGVNFVNKENYQLNKVLSTNFGKVDLSYDLSKNKTIELVTRYNNSDNNVNSDLSFNDLSTKESLSSPNIYFEQKINYTNKFRDNKVLLVTGRYINNASPQSYNTNQFFFQSLFPDSKSINGVQQASENNMQFFGLNLHILDRKKNQNLLEIQAGNEYRLDYFNSNFTLVSDTAQPQEFASYQNRLNFATNDLYIKSKYQYYLKAFSIIGKLEGHSLFNTLNIKEIKNTQSPVFVNPSLGFDWEINKKNQIFGSYSFNKTNVTVIDVYSDFILTSSRSFTKGAGQFNQLNASTLLLNHQLGNWSDKFFANTFVFYTQNHDFFSTNTIINRNFSQSEKILIKGRDMISVSSSIDRFFNGISSNMKLEISYSKSNYKNIVNSTDLRQINSTSFIYGAELHSAFNGVFNYHFGTKWTVNQIKTSFSSSFIDNFSFADISFVINNKFNLNLQSERYLFGNVDRSNNTYYFLDVESRVIIKPNKLSVLLAGKNLFNTDRFVSSSISDISSSSTQYRLLPRYVLLKMEYRF